MKSILLSIKPEWVAKILNGQKTIEIRKKFPKDYVGWVYIYCTKSNKHHWYLQERYDHSTDEILGHSTPYYIYIKVGEIMTPRLDGKVVARFWCDKVEEIFERVSLSDSWFNEGHFTKTLKNKELLEKSCLDILNINKYLEYPKHTIYGVGYAIHISKLEVFDKPRELSEFIYYECPTKDKVCKKYCIGCGKKLVKKAPQNYCYVEGEEK